jgi:hypothetical protein
MYSECVPHQEVHKNKMKYDNNNTDRYVEP